MKRYVYVLAFVVSFMSLVACSKNDPAPTSPVIGRWDSNRGILSGFPTSTTANAANGAVLDLYLSESLESRIDVYSDNTFNQNIRYNFFVFDQPGTWAFSNNTLTLTYDQGGQDTFTYSKNKNIEELTSTTPQSYTLDANAVGKIQVIYRK